MLKILNLSDKINMITKDKLIKMMKKFETVKFKKFYKTFMEFKKVDNKETKCL